MQRKLLLVVSLVILMTMSVATVASAQTNDNIVDIAAANDDFDTLHAAIVAAGLADTLASAVSTFTVFAPTDAAFAALEAANPGILDAVLSDPTGLLTTILTYHVVGGEYLSGDVLAATSLPTLQGESLTVSMRNGAPYVDDSQIVAVDIAAKNGVIHVIDSVLLPDIVVSSLAGSAADTTVTETEDMPDATSTEAGMTAEETDESEMSVADTTSTGTETAASGKTIAEVAAEAGNFTSLLNALEATGLAETFASPGRYTVFAPTDAAFAAFDASGFSAGELESILLFHVVGDTLSRDQLATDDLVPTLDGRPLMVNRDGSQILDISGAKVLVYDIQASNGVIHVIDRVLIP